MGERLSRFGVGPKIFAFVAAYAFFAFALTSVFPGLCSVPAFRAVAVVTGGMFLLAIGIPMWLAGAVAAMKAYNSDHLVTTGVFALVRHPMYSAWIVLILPGIALLTASWPFLLMPVAGYAAFKSLIHNEDQYLQERFGQAYLDYRAAVHELLPMPGIHHAPVPHH